MPAYHFSHIALYYWTKYLQPQNYSERRFYAQRYDTYCNMQDDGYDEVPA